MNGLYHLIYSRGFAAAVLLASLIMLLASGLHNVANGFADVKFGSSPWIHWGGALAIELGVVAIGLTVAVRARSGDQNFRLYGGILLFVAASMFANYDASLESLVGGAITWDTIRQLDAWTLAKAALLGGAIPLMVLLVIESPRELAAEGGTDTVPYRDVVHPERATSPNGRTAARQVSRGHDDDQGVSLAVVSDGTGVPETDPGTLTQMQHKGTREAMRRLMVQEPEITATDISRRLGVARATVYRWRDDLGAERVAGKWVVS